MEGDLVERLRERLEREEDVLVAYLHGSHASGRPGPLSDVDVAVLLREDADRWQRLLDLIGAVSEVVGSERADVVVLNEAPAALAYRVLRDGILLFSRDDVARVRHRTHVIDRYLDMEPMRRMLREGVRDQIREGRFGRR
jgi:predicted nucleotidyltransferase